MPLVASGTGYIHWEKPTQIRRAEAQGRMRLYSSAMSGFYYRVYPDDPSRTDAAEKAIAKDFARQMRFLKQYEAKRDPDRAAATHATAASYEAFCKRVRNHEREILRERGLPSSTPLDSLALPFERKRVHLEGSN